MSINEQSAASGLTTLPSPRQGRLGYAASRRMCAATYLDPAYRNRVLRGIYNDRRRRVAPSYGFDVVLVLRHAWRSWWLESVQHILMVAVFTTVAVLMPLETFIAACSLAIWYVLRISRNVVAEMYRYLTGDSFLVDIRQLQTRARLLKRALVSLLVLLMITVIAAMRHSTPPGTHSGFWLVRAGVAGAGVIVAIFAVIVATVAVIRIVWLGQLRRKDSGHIMPCGKRLRAIHDQQHHPFTVHSGFRPFIGSGDNVRSWSFAQRLISRKLAETEFDQEYDDDPPFTASELIDRLKKMISELREDDHPETRLPGLEVRDHVFVEGTHAGPFLQALTSSRESDEVKEAIAKAIANSSDVARHYLACQVDSWGGEIVTSVFVHVSLQGRVLYLEFSTYALLPTRAEYHVIDEVGGTGARAAMKAIARDLIGLPDRLLAVWRLVSAPAQVWAGLRSGKDQTARWGYRIDIGATVSARESAAREFDESYFQYQDVLQHSKIIERRLIATVGEFLAELGVDTSEFWERATIILNTGVINRGPGTVNVVNGSVGDEANITVQSGPPGGQPGARTQT